ncbi:MAG: hypothetical protein PHX34_01505 [Candidatus Shapirobacteria bacterium]|nr:hypothetical protein [Candidatus Shapirobacteria bacterium]
MKFLEFFAWYGTVVTLLAYFLNSFQLLKSNSLLFQLANLTGSLGLALFSFTKNVYQSAIVSAIWFIIALISIFHIFLRDKN